MYLTVHASAGLIIGSQVGNPWLAFVLGVISHFLMDMIPHDPLEMKKYFEKREKNHKFALIAITDILIMIMIGLILWDKYNLVFTSSIIAAIIGSLLPDLAWGWSDLLRIKNKITVGYFEFHEWFHKVIHKPIYIPGKYAYPMQVIILILLLWLYSKL